MGNNAKKGFCGCFLILLLIPLAGALWYFLRDDRPENEYARIVYEAELPGYEGISIGHAFTANFWKSEWKHLEKEGRHAVEFVGLLPERFYSFQLNETWHMDDAFRAVFLIGREDQVKIVYSELIHTCPLGRRRILPADERKIVLNRIYGRAAKALGK